MSELIQIWYLLVLKVTKTLLLGCLNLKSLLIMLFVWCNSIKSLYFTYCIYPYNKEWNWKMGKNKITLIYHKEDFLESETSIKVCKM